MTSAALVLAPSVAESPIPMWMLAIPFVVVIAVAVVCVRWARRERARGVRGLRPWAPMLVSVVVIGALYVWMSTVW